MKTAVLLGLALAGVAQGHAIFQKLRVNSVDQGLYNSIRVPTYDGPQQDVSQPAMACNTGFLTPISNGVVTIPSAAKVEFWWQHVLGGPQGAGDPDNPISASHKGPIMTYLARVGGFSNATDFDFAALDWFKIGQDAFDPADQSWGVDRMIANAGWTSITLPSCIAPGNYVLRHELLALHAAGSSGGAQFYSECANVLVTGTSGTLTPATVKIPGAYKATDPGILINIYQTLPSYKAPGPDPITCGGGGVTSVPPATTLRTSTTTVKPPATTTATPTTTMKPTTTTTKPPTTTTTTPLGSGAPLYGQCGGQGWTGPTTCAQGKCTVSNQYYSQCLP